TLMYTSTIAPIPPTSTPFPYTTLFRSQILLDVGPVETQILPRVGVVLLAGVHRQDHVQGIAGGARENEDDDRQKRQGDERLKKTDRKSTRLNSSHVSISYAVFCLKKKK